MKILFKSILVFILFFVGVAIAAPTKVDERVQYASSLNVMASSLMNWYGSLIVEDGQDKFSRTEEKWKDYRSHYPENITHIEISTTDLLKLDEADTYQFKVTTQIHSEKSGEMKNQALSETFVFHVPLLDKAVLKHVSRESIESITTNSNSEFDSSYFKARYFTYAWLAYLDGVDDMEQTINVEQWLENAPYSMKIGGIETQGSIATTLTKRQVYLTRGGHTLRSLEVRKIEDKADHFSLDLIVDWKGINKDGKPVIAKVHQQIEVQIQQNNEWKIISIKEDHQLPDIAPWAGFLC